MPAQSEPAPPLTAIELELAKRCEDDLRIFTEEGFKQIDPAEYVHGRHLDMMAEYAMAFIDGEIPRLLINIPPGHMKSIECSVMLNGWTWTKPERAGRRFVGLSYRQDLALRDGDKVRTLIASDWYQQRWGHVGALRGEAFTINKGQNKVSRFVNSKGGYRYSTPVSGVMGEGGDFVIFDDPHNVEKAESNDVLEKTIQLINLALPTRVRSPDGGILVIMQRLRERDMSGDMIAKGGDLVHLCLPARYEKKHPHVTVPVTLKSGRVLPGDFRTEEGQLLFPELFSASRLDDIALHLGAYGEAGQLQQRPAPREGGMFQREDFQIIDKLPKGPYIEVRGWDLGATEGGGKYTAGVKCRYYYRRGMVVVMHVTRGQWSSFKVEQNMATTAKNDGNIIQDVPQDPGQAGKSQKRYIARALKGHKVRFGLETGSKETRADALSSQAEAGNVYLLRGEWNDPFIDEADVFPNGTYTDQIDGWSRAFARILIELKGRKPTPHAPELVEA